MEEKDEPQPSLVQPAAKSFYWLEYPPYKLVSWLLGYTCSQILSLQRLYLRGVRTGSCISRVRFPEQRLQQPEASYYWPNCRISTTLLGHGSDAVALKLFWKPSISLITILPVDGHWLMDYENLLHLLLAQFANTLFRLQEYKHRHQGTYLTHVFNAILHMLLVVVFIYRRYKANRTASTEVLTREWLHSVV
jgi:hypothetical protein